MDRYYNVDSFLGVQNVLTDGTGRTTSPTLKADQLDDNNNYNSKNNNTNSKIRKLFFRIFE